ncbi:MAG: AAA family ATPase [Proteobacteria bacterium]|nr:AAA family ATPase [Pseudomonadota bacterium]
MSLDIDASEYQRALMALESGAPIVFVTGKAGSGKSTLIRWILEQNRWQAAVVAPTGIAALNVGGATIHSFFKFPPRLLSTADARRMKDRRLYKKLRLLVIDEVSMVRADVMDAVARFLELNGPEPDKPFGGVQLLLVGDLFQLQPVVDEREMGDFFRRAYRSPHFFSARAVQDTPLVSIELERVFRQRDPAFADLLNQLREGRDVEGAIAEINARCHREPDESQIDLPRVVLTPTNRAASMRNAAALRTLEGENRRFTGRFAGAFDPRAERLPSPERLDLKPGAQVMFTKNDPFKRWVNGSLGIVREFKDDGPVVEVAHPGHEGTRVAVDVKPVAWETVRYTWEPVTETIAPEVLGEYVQLPLMLGWATTIHKAQGKTLDAVEIDLDSGAFAAGQVYVALSRCRELDAITLTRPIRVEDVTCDAEIMRFYAELKPCPQTN